MNDKKHKKEFAPMYEKADMQECTHTGYFVPMGYEAFDRGNNQFSVVAGKLCIRCGIEFHSIIELTKPPTGIN